MTSITDQSTRVELFGGIRLIHGLRTTTHFRLQKSALLLAYLALHIGRTISRERLIDIFWPELELEAGRDNLSTALSSLRRELRNSGSSAETLLADRQQISLNPKLVTTDVADFELSLKQARSSASVQERVRLLEAATALYRGDLLDTCYDEWAVSAQSALRRRYLEALIDLAEDYETLQQWDDAQAAAETAASIDSLHEQAVQVMVRVQARQARVAAAIDSFQQFRQRLLDELGVEPTQELRLLVDRIQRDPDAFAVAKSPDYLPEVSQQGDQRAGNAIAAEDANRAILSSETAVAVRGNLPQWLTPLIGRGREVQESMELIASNRLLTLTGIGGCGKTRLSLEIGSHVQSEFADGVWFIELAALSDPTLVASSIANIMEIKEEQDKSTLQALLNALKEKRCLVILDNCEHLLESCAQVVSTVLHTCRYVNIVATSREALTISGEQTYRVPSLALPASNVPIRAADIERYGAIQLFLQRARLVSANFSITDTIAPHIVSICQRLDGIPLAIELASARVRSMSVEELDRRLDDRFNLLTGGNRLALPRQQTLRSLIDWSYDLLRPAERTTLNRLSVFAGGWTLEAAIRICAESNEAADQSVLADVLELLSNLADKSLVIAEVHSGTVRYRLLETVRQYARDRMAESGRLHQVQEQHVGFYLALAEQLSEGLAGPEQRKLLTEIENELDNMRQAIAVSIDRPDGAEIGLRFGVALGKFWRVRGHFSEGRELLAALLARPPRPENVGTEREPGPPSYQAYRASGLSAAAYLARDQSDYETARTMFEESLALRRSLDDQPGIALALSGLGSIANDRGDYPLAISLHEQSLQIRRGLYDQRGIAECLGHLGTLYFSLDDYPKARALCEESLELQRSLGDSRGIASVLGNLGIMARYKQDYPTAQANIEEALSLYREIGDRRNTAIMLGAMVNVMNGVGNKQTADVLLKESLVIRREIGDKRGVLVTLSGYAHFAGNEQKNPERGVRLWGAVYSLRESIGSTFLRGDNEAIENEIARLKSILGEKFDVEWQVGRAMSWQNAVAYALCETP